MKITKRNLKQQAFMPNKILTRLKQQSKGLKVNADKLFQLVIPHIKDGITTTEIDQIISFKSANLQVVHPDYGVLGGRILMSRQAKNIGTDMKDVDYTFDIFATSTFLQKYSKKNEKGERIEIPSMMYERVVNHLYPTQTEDHKELLDELCAKKINFATPILANS